MPSQASTLLLCAFCAILPVTLVLSVAVLPILVALAALAAIVAVRRDGFVLSLPRGPLVWLVLLLLIWALAASLWGFRVERALWLVLRLGLLGLASGLLFAIAARLEAGERALVARWLCIGFACGLAIFVFERLTDNLLHELGGEINPGRSAFSILNRAATGLALLLWPVTAVLYRGTVGRWSLLLPPFVLGLLLFYESQAAIIGVATGLAMLIIALLSLRAATYLLVGLIVIVMLASPFIAGQIDVPNTFETGWIAHSAQHRLHVWQYAADRILDRPLFGWGFDSSNRMPNMGVEPFEGAKRVIPSHPHNAALQIWLELGLVGTLIVLGILLSLWRLLDRLSAFDRAAAIALFVAGLVVANLSYGIWQSKWVATLIAMALVVVATRDGVGRQVAAEREAAARADGRAQEPGGPP